MRTNQSLGIDLAAIPVIRTDRRNLNHHLWNNNGTWWCHFTVHLPNFTKRRIRQSLHTGDPQIARGRRDNVFEAAAARNQNEIHVKGGMV